MSSRPAWTVIVGFCTIIFLGAAAQAAECGNTGEKFERWKAAFTVEAKKNGIRSKGITALNGTYYSPATIKADRSQKSFDLSFSQFMQLRGASAIVARGRLLKRTYAPFLATLEKRYGVPPGPLLAIWGMETGFGKYTGSQNALSAVATLAYDCRRQDYFTDQLYAALKLIDRGALSPSTKGAMQGEFGQTQFLPKNLLLYGEDGDGDGVVDLNSKKDALTSTAKFFQANGWVAGAAYQPGQPNFAVIQSWNAASVYERAIAAIGKQIDSD